MNNHFLKLIRLVFSNKINLFKTLYFLIRIDKRYSCRRIIVCRRVSMYLEKNSKIQGEGEFFIGHDMGKFPRKSRTNLRVGKNAQITVDGKYSILSGSQVNVDDNATFEMGSGYINHDAKIHCGKQIKIGHNVIIGEDVRIRDTDSHKIAGIENAKPILIEDNVWIGMRCTILKGVTIGAGSVVAANSLVIKDVPSNCLVGGCPAKILKSEIHWEF